jgi:shikimate dehydrogenase
MMVEQESGRRRFVVGLVGAGIQQSLSPALHERLADASGLRYCYQRIDLDLLGRTALDAPELVREAQRMGFGGLNVTHPAKRTLARVLDAMSPAARVLNAVNTVVFDGGRLLGFNTDHTGFRRSLERTHPSADLSDVVVVGAGGAGSAAAYALVGMGVGRLTLVDADPAGATGLREVLANHGARVEVASPTELPAVLARATGVVQATPVGMSAHPGTPFDPALLEPALWVAELVYRPVETELLTAARAIGCTVVPGTGMTVFQAAESFELFTGCEADTAAMFDHMEELLEMEAAR